MLKSNGYQIVAIYQHTQAVAIETKRGVVSGEFRLRLAVSSGRTAINILGAVTDDGDRFVCVTLDRLAVTPIATGERHISKHDFFELITRTDVDIIQPDIMNTGGSTEAKKITAIAEADRVSFAPHNPQGPVTTAINVTSTPSSRISSFRKFSRPMMSSETC